MAATPARSVQNTVIAVVALIGTIAATLGTGWVSIGDEAVLRNTTFRTISGGLGLTLLVAAGVALVWPRWSATLPKVAFSVVLVGLILGFAELAARAAGYPAEPTNPRYTTSIADPELGFVCRPNDHFRFLGPHGWVEGTSDAEGHRPTLTCADQLGTPAVICLGDSTTFSIEVRDEDTWPEAAARALRDRGKPHRMLNRGLGGYSGVQSLLALRRALANSRDVRAVIYHFCINDPVENFGSYNPGPVLRPRGDSFEVVPPLSPEVELLGGRRAWPTFSLWTAFRVWSNTTTDEGYRTGLLPSYPAALAFYQRFLDEPLLRAGMHFVLSQMQYECHRRGVKFFVSIVNSPIWDVDGRARAELRPMLPGHDFVADSAMVWAANDELIRLAKSVGAEYLETRGCLEGLSFREYVAAPRDWHYAGPANERIGRAIAAQLEPHLK